MFTLPTLPYAKDGLAPQISAETIDYHYGKHHATYVTKLNGLVKGTPDESKTLEQLIKEKTGAIFNNAAQTWNHTFYWESLGKGHSGPTGPLAEAIDKDFGSFEKFKQDFTENCSNHFGSGWVWLVKATDGKLKILQTHDADTPIRGNDKPLLTCDVWEHAYYIDHRNNRGAYITAFFQVINWENVAKRFSH